MMVMPANNSKMVVGYLAGIHPGKVGHLYSPGGLRGPYGWLPYALDNGAFPCWQKGQSWDESVYLGFLDRVAESPYNPRWILVPDVVADRDETLRKWDAWAPRLRKRHRGWPLAFAVQDGMTAEDVPEDADVVFVGGTTEWKKKTLHDWADAFERVHVGRINSPKWLWECDRAGVESCDGTGWFRGDKVQLAGLVSYLYRSANGMGEPQQHLFAYAGSWQCICGCEVGPSYAECPSCHGPKPDHVAARESFPNS